MGAWGGGVVQRVSFIVVLYTGGCANTVCRGQGGPMFCGCAWSRESFEVIWYRGLRSISPETRRTFV